jgi:hypothetical protein
MRFPGQSLANLQLTIDVALTMDGDDESGTQKDVLKWSTNPMNLTGSIKYGQSLEPVRQEFGVLREGATINMAVRVRVNGDEICRGVITESDFMNGGRPYCVRDCRIWLDFQSSAEMDFELEDMSGFVFNQQLDGVREPTKDLWSRREAAVTNQGMMFPADEVRWPVAALNPAARVPEEVGNAERWRTREHMRILAGSQGAMPALVSTQGRLPLARGVSQLHEAVERGDVESIGEWSDRSALINSKDEQGCTPLAWAALAGNLAAIQALVALGG